MSWLRIDDGFPEHPKLIALGGPADRWTWLELLAYCARRSTDGVVPPGISDVLRRVTPSFISRCEAVGLLDRDGVIHRVHDWKDYNPKDPTKASRQARWRASRNGDVDAPVDGDVDEASVYTDRLRDGAPHAGTRARTRPVPNPLTTQAAATTTATDAAALNNLLDQLGVNGGTRTAAHQEPDRATACAQAALNRGTKNPAGLFRTLIQSGEWPTETPTQSGTNLQPKYTIQDLSRLIDRGVITEAVDLDGELADIPDLTDSARDELHAKLRREA